MKTAIALVFFLLMFMSTGPGFAATTTLNSCEMAEVQQAILDADSGDTIILPEGTATWTTHTPKEPSVVIGGKSLILKGAGIDKTLIIDGTASAYTKEDPLEIDAREGHAIRITGITFRNPNDRLMGQIRINGESKAWRIDHCKFEVPEAKGYGVLVGGYTYGLIDHCHFINTEVFVDEFTGDDASWARPLGLGTQNAVYVENCRFEGANGVTGDTIDGHGGARYVFRYNTTRDMWLHAHGHDTAGTGVRSTFSYEFYGNTLQADQSLYRGVYLRGGTGVVYDNVFTGKWGHIHLYHYCACVKTAACPDTLCTYPCKDQVGRSTNQTLEPVYAWNNTLNGNPFFAEADLQCDAIKRRLKKDVIFTTPGVRIRTACPSASVDQRSLFGRRRRKALGA